MAHPIIIYPAGVRRPMVAFGSSGIICRDSYNDTEVLKSPLRHDLSRCSEETILSMQEEESFSSMSLEREKLIYRSLPKHRDILNCLKITETSIRFPYMHNGHLRDYIRKNSAQVDDLTKDTWIQNAVMAVQFIHAHSVIHGDISVRNFLVADDLSIKLCDFAGSGIGDLSPVVMEEDRYRKSPDEPRSFQTDLFALGCLIFEIVVGSRPYEDIGDDDWEIIADNYDRGVFPSVEGLRYGTVIYKCWTSQYTEARQILLDIGNADYGGKERSGDDVRSVWPSLLPVHALPPLGILPIGILALCAYRKYKWT
ncbi:kinase-like protein [Aspergillus sclerotioniger CBS 115572]|uniref:EKC/KEOPS complex subunit BUD32 n=1 Tax=Aspergillus sclerotioniger CBS 115572 TaxID=1450535 RepID=A0A317WYC4_9EURO|nr:kinase-like protein [Aspergillus sclerotioniger CBS 115572]PWY90267.1 kinase-like protein [Aspergillus sclerotioniger CBS 115572]